MNFDLIVIGSGPGGYVTAIRASQLGLKTAIVEKESLGGICLNWGCIPTKALLKSAQVFDYINHASDYGIKVNNPEADFSAIINRSREVANGMSGGIAYLMKKNNPIIIPRNHLVEKALEEAGNGNIEEFQRLLYIISNPYQYRDDLVKFMKPSGSIFEKNFQTYCGT